MVRKVVAIDLFSRRNTIYLSSATQKRENSFKKFATLIQHFLFPLNWLHMNQNFHVALFPSRFLITTTILSDPFICTCMMWISSNTRKNKLEKSKKFEISVIQFSFLVFVYFSPSLCVCVWAVSCWYIDVSRTSWIACYLIRWSSLFAYCWVWARATDGFRHPPSQWAHSSVDQTYMHPIGIRREGRKRVRGQT